MTTAERMLRRFLDHPQRKIFVIILTCVLALVTVWPVVDEYFVIQDACAQLELSIVEAEEEASSAPALRKAATERSAQLSELRKRTMTLEGVHEFSSDVVEMTRAAGCQLRRVDLGTVQKRRWYENDNPLSAPPPNGKETPFELSSQRIALSITGPLDRVQTLLAELHRMDKLSHTQSMQLKPADEQRREVNLDLELLFFDLTRVKKSKAT